MPIYKMDGKKDGLQKYRVRINYTDSSGKAKQLERVAYGKEAAKELELQLNRDIKEETVKKITLQQLYDEYITVKQYEVRESTLDKMKKLLNTYIVPPLKSYRLDRLTIGVLQKWKTDIQEHTTSAGNPLSLGYKKKIFSAFRSMLNYAVKMEYISRNPLSNLGNFKETCSTKKPIEFYTPEEFKQYISFARKQAELCEQNTHNVQEWNFYVFFNIAFYTGMRKGEIYALRWTDISYGFINVERSISQKLKGDDRETAPKNQSSIRTLQIPFPLKKILYEHYNRYKEIDGFADSWYICGGTQCIRDTTVEKRNQSYSSGSGVKKIRIHDFRHSHASLLANNGINIQEIARRLGHSKIEMTWNVYSHLYPREEERAIEILNKIE